MRIPEAGLAHAIRRAQEERFDILLVGRNRQQVIGAFGAARSLAGSAIAHAYNGAGREMVYWPNGSTMCPLAITQRNAGRGRRFDVVVLAPGMSINDIPTDWTPALLTSTWTA